MAAPETATLKTAKPETEKLETEKPKTETPEMASPKAARLEAEKSASERPDWRIVESAPMPADWVDTVAQVSRIAQPRRGAQILWNRGIRTADDLVKFLQPSEYTPASPFEFPEMDLAISRLETARRCKEKVAIWGDFDADGVTSTSVLWDGLSQFYTEPNQLSYFIPNRLKESHGLSLVGVEQLAADGVNLIVTCDTGSTNPIEIKRANALGMDVIVTDHHTLPKERPAVVAIINPRALPAGHAMADLSGVAVTYKLVEAMYERLPDVPNRPLRSLLDLVAIGLIADLVELRGDCRYLAQVGIAQLQTHLKALAKGEVPDRPGVAKLLQLCRRSGDRPTDISFGIGPRINAVSRIYGDASFCVELLTSQDTQRCQALAEKAELANARRKALQNDVLQQIRRQLDARDLSTMSVIVLCDAQWPVGVLGLVAGQVAQQYGRPTILLTADEPAAAESSPAEETLARGSARSVNGVDLYELMSSQAHLLSGFGGHPFAAGMSLPLSNLDIFTAAINQQYRQQIGAQKSGPVVTADSIVTVAELGCDLFRELKLLEPCGMGNLVPKLLIQNCWFENVWHQKLKDRTGGKVGYIKTSFWLCDESTNEEPTRRFPGLWWGHYKDELPPGQCDVVAELDYNSHPKSQRYEIRLVDVRPSNNRLHEDRQREDRQADESTSSAVSTAPAMTRWLIDRRIKENTDQQKDSDQRVLTDAQASNAQITQDISTAALILDECPTQWEELSLWQHQSAQTHQPVALAYASPAESSPTYRWKMLLGVAKHLSSVKKAVTAERLCERLEICDRTLTLGLAALSPLGFVIKRSAIDIRFQYAPQKSKDCTGKESSEALGQFLAAVQEEQFRRRYFYKAPVSTLEAAKELLYKPQNIVSSNHNKDD